ncbi:anti-sigma factor [Proteus phage SJ_PmiM]|nr:anti-sigma factor [Proteus phage SJ_PmiM]
MQIEDVIKKYTQIRKSAKSRNKEFNLTLRYVKNICEQTKCAYSGEAMEMPKDVRDLEGISFERFDNSKGYIKGNVIPVKGTYNCYKSSMTLEDIKKKIEYVNKEKTEAISSITKFKTKLINNKRNLSQHPNNKNLRKNVMRREKALKNLEEEHERCIQKKDRSLRILNVLYKAEERFNKLSKYDKLKLYLGISLDSSYKRVGKELYVLLCDSLQRRSRI